MIGLTPEAQASINRITRAFADAAEAVRINLAGVALPGSVKVALCDSVFDGENRERAAFVAGYHACYEYGDTEVLLAYERWKVDNL